MSNDAKELVPGGKIEVDPERQDIQEIAAYAVTEYNKEEHKHLKLEKVIKAMTQVVAGVKYYITLEASEGEINGIYYAEVLEQAWIPYKKLLSFKKLLKANMPSAN